MKNKESIQKEIKKIKIEIDGLNKIIAVNTKAVEWFSKVSERNAKLIKLESLKQQLSQNWHKHFHPFVTINTK